MSNRRKWSWFRLNRQLHRDFGYFCIGLTIVFAVSGIALNHLEHWNPNYIVSRYEKPFTVAPSSSEQQLNQSLLAAFDVAETIKASYWESPQQYKIFFQGGGSLSANFSQQIAVYEQIRTRPVFNQFNHLHLNKAQQGWIIFSDIYAVLLLYLAISALFMVKGKYSPWRRRKCWLVIAGILIPAIYIFV